jgi:hypothetical protein
MKSSFKVKATNAARKITAQAASIWRLRPIGTLRTMKALATRTSTTMR